MRATCSEQCCGSTNLFSPRSTFKIEESFSHDRLRFSSHRTGRLAPEKASPSLYPYAPSHVPCNFPKNRIGTTLGAGQKKGYSNLVDLLVNDPAVARLYWEIGPRTIPKPGLLCCTRPDSEGCSPMPPPLIFYGSHISIRSGRVIVPGGAWTQISWRDLVGASPENPGEFVPRLLAKDNGWLACIFRCLSRVSQFPARALTEGTRLKRFYEDLRGNDLEPAATRGVFRQAPTFWSCYPRPMGANGEPYIPGISSLETDPSPEDRLKDDP